MINIKIFDCRREDAEWEINEWIKEMNETFKDTWEIKHIGQSLAFNSLIITVWWDEGTSHD